MKKTKLATNSDSLIRIVFQVTPAISNKNVGIKNPKN